MKEIKEIIRSFRELLFIEDDPKWGLFFNGFAAGENRTHEELEKWLIDVLIKREKEYATIIFTQDTRTKAYKKISELEKFKEEL